MQSREKIYPDHQYITTKETRLRKVNSKLTVNYREGYLVGFTTENGIFAETTTLKFRSNSKLI